MKVSITDKLLTQLAAAPPAKETIITDAQLRGFYIRVGPSGRATFYARATVDGRRARPVKIGTSPAMASSEARKRALTILASAALGVDAGDERRARRAADTLEELIEAYLTSSAFGRLAPSTRLNDMARLRAHVVPRVGRTLAPEFTPRDARRLKDEIEHDDRTSKRGRKMGGEGVANKTIRTLSAVLTWAVEVGKLERNPLPGAIKLSGGGVREAVIDGPAGYSRLFSAMDDLVLRWERGDARNGISPIHRDLFTLLAATGLRRGEALGLRWTDVDFARGTLQLSATKGARLRAQRSGGTPRSVVVAAPPVAMAALARLREFRSNETGAPPPNDQLVFEGQKPGRPVSCSREWDRVRAAADLPADLTLHGLRHSLGTAAAIGGLDGLSIQRLLRHANPATTARYIHAAQATERLADRAAELAMGDLASSRWRSK